MKTILNDLAKILIQSGWTKTAQKVQELEQAWSEPWHEEAAQEFGEDPISEETYFRENLQLGQVEHNLHQQIMEEVNFLPHSSSGGSRIGSGVFGSVYEGIWDGKPAVIKVDLETTNEHGDNYHSNEEPDNWRAILKAKDQLPPQLAKTIPEVFQVGSGYLNGLSYSFVIMEKLYPLSKQIKEVIYSLEPKANQRLLNDEEYLWEVALLTEQFLNQLPLLDNIGTLSAQEIHKLIMEVPSLNSYSSQDIANKIADRLMALTKEEQVQDLIQKVDGATTQGLHSFLVKEIYTVISPSINAMATDMPLDYEDFWESPQNPQWGEYSKYFESTPETATFYATLRNLMENHGISWRDVHTGNMMQDRDGNLKIIDVGLYVGSK